ncbi:MAG: hypothetical protein IPM56_11175 [Ignavibacteriales bacterium]|nr:MAG: hypothetical protein IPM56_11175 [Ignavibacteriales bacterium]
MKGYLFTAVISFVLFLTGCGAPTAILTKEYSNQKLSDKTVSIVQLFEKPLISNKDDVLDDLGEGIPEEVYISFFKQNFINSFNTSNCCSEVNYFGRYSGSDLTEQTLVVSDKEKLKILLPKENEGIKSDSLTAEFILFIDNLNVSRISGSSGYWTGNQHSGGSFATLFHELTFALWDNQNQKLASYGRINEECAIPFGMTKDSWAMVIDGLVIKILEYCPFPVSNRLFQ